MKKDEPFFDSADSATIRVMRVERDSITATRGGDTIFIGAHVRLLMSTLPKQSYHSLRFCYIKYIIKAIKRDYGHNHYTFYLPETGQVW